MPAAALVLCPRLGKKIYLEMMIEDTNFPCFMIYAAAAKAGDDSPG